MAGKIRNEDLQLNIIVNGDAGRKQMLELDRSIHDVKTSIKATETKLRELNKAGKDGTKEYLALNKVLEEQKKSLANSQEQFARLRSQITLENKTISELREQIKLTNAALSKAVPGTENWNGLNQTLQQAKTRLKELTDQSKAVHYTTCEMTDKLSKYAVSIYGAIGAVQNVFNKFTGARDSFLAYDEALTDAMKTTNLTKGEILDLSDSLKQIDTKTPQNELLALVRAGGKLGITGQEDLLGFARAADKINVALSEDLGGNAEAAITAIGKMTDIFSLTDEYGIEQAMLKVGSAINELGMASTANEGYIVDFSKRLAGIAPNADISIDKILGLAATLDKYGQQSETASTAIGQTIMAMFKRTETFAQIAGVPLKEFSEILKTDVNEALLKVLEGMQRGEGGLASVTAAMEEMHLNGQRAATVLGSLSKHTDELRSQQEIANKAFVAGTSLTEEFAVKNNSLTAELEKQKKAILDNVVNLGEKLNPAMSEGLTIANGGLKVISGFIGVAVKLRMLVYALTAAYVANAIAKKAVFFWSKAHREELNKELLTLDNAKAQTIAFAVVHNLLAGNVKGAVAALKMLGKTIKSNPIGAFIGLISAAAYGIYNHIKSAKEATKSQRELNKSFTETIDKISRERSELERMGKAVTDAKVGSQERARAIKELNNRFGEYLPHLLTEKSSNEEVASALKLANTELERKIKLQAMEEAQTKIFNSLTDAASKATDSVIGFLERWNQTKLTTSQIEAVTKAVVDYREAMKAAEAEQDPLKESAALSLAKSNLAGKVTAAGLNYPDMSRAQNAQEAYYIRPLVESFDKILDGLRVAVTAAVQDEAKLNGLYGVASSGPVDESSPDFIGPTLKKTKSSVVDNPPGGGPADKWSLSSDGQYLQAVYDLKEQYRQGDIKSEDEYQKKILELEIRMLQDRIASGKETGEKLLSLKSQLADKQIKLQKDESDAERAQVSEAAAAKKKQIEDEVSLLESQYRLEKTAMEAKNSEELAASKATGEELTKLKKEQAKRLADIDLNYLKELQAELEKIIKASDSPDFMKLDGGSMDALKQKLQEIRKTIAEVVGSQSAGDKTSTADVQTKSKGSLFGVGQDEWNQLFQNIADGKYGLEDLTNTVTALEGAFSQMFSLWSQSSELQAARDKSDFKRYEKQNDKKKKSLEKRLNAGLISEAQYNAEIESLENEKDAYQEQMELKQAKRQKAQKLTQAIINTALGVTKTLSEWGIPWGIAPAAIMGAMGAAEAAMIAATPISTGAEDGGYVNTTRKQDGKKFKARLSPDKRGFISSPTVLVGENGGEYVIPASGLANPSLQPFLATLETARRNGTLKDLNFDAVYPLSATVARAEGGNTQTIGVAPVITSGTSDNTRLVEAIETLNKRLSAPIRADVSMLGKNGIVEQTEKYNKYKTRGRL
ncbi:MAG: phage tail tape measure protein [Bacteroides sp.]|nr:phage tail tape measure protein [Bacteroides sp.]